MPIFGLLERLGIDRFRDPWVWMTTEGTVTPEHARLRVNDGGPSWYDPLYPQDIRTFEGYSFEMLGIRLADEAAPYYGLRQLWSGPPTDVRYVEVRREVIGALRRVHRHQA